MEITIACPNCRYSFRITDDLCGKRMRCLKCHTVFTPADEQIISAEKPPRRSAEPVQATAPDESAQDNKDWQPPRSVPRHKKVGTRTHAEESLLSASNPFIVLLALVGGVWILLLILNVLIGGAFLFGLLLLLGLGVCGGGVSWCIMVARTGKTRVEDFNHYARPLITLGAGCVQLGFLFPLSGLGKSNQPATSPWPLSGQNQSFATLPPFQPAQKGLPPGERLAIRRSNGVSVPGRPQETTDAQARKLFANGPRDFLSELQEFDVRRGPWPFSKRGTLGDGQNNIYVNAVLSPNGLSMHPPDNGYSSVKYRLDGKAALLKAQVALDDTVLFTNAPAIFEVLGDDKQVWQSLPIGKPRQAQELSVPMTGVRVLELRVHATGFHFGVHGVWVEPRLLQKADTADN